MAQGGDGVYALVRTTYPDCHGAPCVDEMRAKLTGPTGLHFEMTDEGLCPIHRPIVEKAQSEARTQKTEPEQESGSGSDSKQDGTGTGAGASASADPMSLEGLNISTEAMTGEKE
ncbi:hypothetical protein A1O7_09637 [Cladophialophora yegresii CBS 114405]|uniref:Uncharacterized protein n=1 Tax=Cladophialophora yegresii CBS 114405 TaxID=1182544 RepID=W9W6X5_9EURO|nr:uncharacterized protein A1O7_09637 [Cladophialophora yegresii CBS 114405]EXJ54299.1 hypothetical protein A1O7_09637 [Cladophialophora yegresii CBS 114405]